MALILKNINDYMNTYNKKEKQNNKVEQNKKKEQKLFTLITSGTFKGKKLALPSLSTTRSTKSIVRQSFFNTIRYMLNQCCFIEGFGGSALMACEAVSNGALKAVAIEVDTSAYKLTRSNCESLNINNIESLLGDSFELLPKIIQNTNTPIILYLDPPFNIRYGFEDIYDRLFNLISSFDNKSIFLICFEHSSDVTMPENIGSFALKKSKKFGKTTLSYYF